MDLSKEQIDAILWIIGAFVIWGIVKWKTGKMNKEKM